MEKEIQTIKQIINDIILKIGLDAKLDVVNGHDGVQFIVRTPEGGLLIGEGGKTLLSFSHVVKKIGEKQIKNNPDFSFSLDINDYQAKKIEELKNTARLNAQRVRYFKKEVVLKPMTSFERRIVHMALTDCPDIITESKGQVPLRQVVIKPLD
jgi:spoIIIJ-associated protein